MRVSRLAGAVGLLLLCAGAAAAQQPCQPPSGAVNPTMQCGMREGTDLRVEQNIAHPNACSFVCDGDNQCMAWTYKSAEKTCHLKSQVPPAAVKSDDCCFTGRKIN